ncbi:N-acetylneuraminate lyase [Alicyclobacillus sp. SO9]|uniref:N-acetylneuraminate lyase n=1 Tax=Alicyclobacillus sp. SO9 TaxID=2665646 RepID=UPI0018E7A9E4|nr:N-acetylneuraminate lyase [Alicyclobacillus sp. SO9]QQE78401.1 N-acetylneuraminate lyase [Alicyclobacillus sp. SO9]
MKGIYSALIVPYDKNGKIIESGLRQIIRHNLDVCHVDGLYVNGSSGENFLISTDEKKLIFEIVKDEVGDKAKLIAQVGSINVHEAIELGKFAASLDYNCLSAVTPFYYKFDFKEVEYYYDSIIGETGEDMLIYSIPSLTGVSMSLSQFDRLFQNDKIVGVKFTSADFYLLERIKRYFSNKLVFSGFDEMLLPAVVYGVDGAIGSTFNVNGKRAKRIFELLQKKDLKAAIDVQNETNDLIERIMDLGGPYQVLKEILKTKGIEAGICRAPMKQFDKSRYSEVEELVQKFSL